MSSSPIDRLNQRMEDLEATCKKRRAIYGLWNDKGWVCRTDGLPYYAPKQVMIAFRHNLLTDRGIPPLETDMYEVRKMGK